MYHPIFTMKTKQIFGIVLSIYLGLTIFALTDNNLLSEDIAMYLLYIPFLLSAGILIKWMIDKYWERISEFWRYVFPLMIAGVFYGFLAIHIFVIETLVCPCLQ